MTTEARKRRSLFLTMLRGSMRARRGRLALAAAAIAIGTSVAAALLLVSIDVGRKVTSELRAYGPNLVLAPPAGEFASFGRALERGSLASDAGFGHEEYAWLSREVTEGRDLVAFAAVRYAAARIGDKTIVVAGTDLQGIAAVFPRMFGGSGSLVMMPSPEAGGWIGRRAAERFGVKAGASVHLVLATESGPRALDLDRVEIFETGGEEDQQLLMPASILDAALGSPGRFHLALARADGDAAHVLAYAKDATKRAPPGALPAGAALRPITRLTEADGRMLHRIRLLLVLVSTVALVAAALCATSTLADLVLERTQEIALLRSLGADSRELMALFLGEAATLGLVGGLAGLAIGLVAAQAIGFGVFGSSIRLAPVVPPVTLLLGVAIALLAAIVPVKHAIAIEPARVLRGE